VKKYFPFEVIFPQKFPSSLQVSYLNESFLCRERETKELKSPTSLGAKEESE